MFAPIATTASVHCSLGPPILPAFAAPFAWHPSLQFGRPCIARFQRLPQAHKSITVLAHEPTTLGAPLQRGKNRLMAFDDGLRLYSVPHLRAYDCGGGAVLHEERQHRAEQSIWQ